MLRSYQGVTRDMLHDAAEAFTNTMRVYNVCGQNPTKMLLNYSTRE